MKFRNTTDTDTADPLDLPAMVDVVFLLLAFYVLGSVFRISEAELSAAYNAPQGGAGEVTRDLIQSVPVTLRPVGPEGERVAITLGERRLPDDGFDLLTQRLDQLALGDMPVALRASGDLTIDQMGRAIDAVLRSAMPNLTFEGLADGR